MATTKKISELGPLENLSNDDEFIVVDKSTTTGDDASSTGSTSKIRFDKLKNQIGSQGEKGPQGEPGAASTVKGPEGPKGEVGAKSTEKGPAGLTITGPKGEPGPQGGSPTFENIVIKGAESSVLVKSELDKKIAYMGDRTSSGDFGQLVLYTTQTDNPYTVVLNAGGNSYINNTNNFGLGIPGPQYKLDIQGDNAALRI